MRRSCRGRYLNFTQFVHVVCFLPERDYVTFESLLSQFRLSSVTLVHPTQEVEAFGNICVYPGHPLTSVQNFTEIVQGEPLRRGVKRKRGIKIERFWTYRRLYLINGTRQTYSFY